MAKRQRLEPGQANTMIARSIGWGNNLFANLPRVLTLPSATLSRPIAKRAVIVGAGPSLETNAHWLRLFDGLVIATNTAAPAVEAAGCTPDLVVAIESMDTTKRCKVTPRRWAVDLQAHPAWFELAGDKAMWLTDQAPSTERMAMDLGAPQLIGGTAALTYGVSLALHWEIREVIIIGADLSYPVDGPAYAKQSGWQDVTTKIANGRYEIDNGPDRIKAALDAKCNPDPGGEVFEIPAWDPSKPPVYASAIFREQRECLSHFPSRYWSTKFVNATEGGAGVDGWEPMEFGLSCGVAARTSCAWHDVRVPRERYLMALRRIHRDAITYQAAATLISTASEHGPVAIAGSHRWCGIADYFHTPDTLRLLADEQMGNAQKVAEAYAVHVAAGELVTCEAERIIAEATRESLAAAVERVATL